MFNNLIDLITNKKDFVTNLAALVIVASMGNGVATNKNMTLFELLSGLGTAVVAYATGKGNNLASGESDEKTCKCADK